MRGASLPITQAAKGWRQTRQRIQQVIDVRQLREGHRKLVVAACSARNVASLLQTGKGQECATTVYDAEEVDADHALESGGLDLLERRRTGNLRILNQDIELAM